MDYQMALAVEPDIVVALDFGRLMRGDHRFAAQSLHMGNEIRAGIAPIRDHPREGEAVQECLRLEALMALPSGQQGP